VFKKLFGGAGKEKDGKTTKVMKNDTFLRRGETFNPLYVKSMMDQV